MKKIIEKKYINEHERILSILGVKIFYSKNVLNDKKIKYCIKIGFIRFCIYRNKNRKHHSKNNILKFDKLKQMLALVFSKCLRNFFEKNDSATTLILGSSTGRCSYIEDENSINMAIDAQDLYYSYQLFKKLSYQIPNLKNLVIYYDIFSSGNDLDKSFMQFSTAYYKFFFDIPYKNKLSAIQKDIIELENKLYKFKDYINKNLDSIPRDIMPITHGGMQTEQELKDWALAEKKLTKKNKYVEIFKEIVR